MNKSGNSTLTWERAPKLRKPVFVVGYHGWSDAGSVASDTLTHIIQTLRPMTLARLDHEPFMVFSLERPTATIENGLLSSVESLSASLEFWINPEGPQDLVLMLAHEPHCNWMTYGSAIAEAMSKIGAAHVITIGGVQDTISHSSSAVISVVCSSTETLASQLGRDAALNPADYKGPISIHTIILSACKKVGIESTGLWAHVPAYLQKNPRQVARLIKILNNFVGMNCETEDLNRESIELDRRIEEALSLDSNLREFVESIEGKEQRKQSDGEGADNIIRLNDFLRREPQKDQDL